MRNDEKDKDETQSAQAEDAQQMNDPESVRIVCAAVQIGDVVHLGTGHIAITKQLVALKISAVDLASCGRGFLTSNLKYVDRFEAARIAIAAGQIKQQDAPNGKLYSDDIDFNG